MKKHSDKLPLPKRYKAAPTTGEVLYEYICASEKLRATAVLQLFDLQCQNAVNQAKKEVKILCGWIERYDGKPSDERLAEKLKKEKERLPKEEKRLTDAEAFASEFRDIMKRCYGMNFPISFLHSIPCRINTGAYFARSLLLSLSSGERYDDMSEDLQNLWDVSLLIETKASDPVKDLKELSRLWINQTATDDELRKIFRAALKQRKATLRPKAGRRGRPSTNEGLLPPKSALNDLWRYLIVRMVAEHKERPVETLLASDAERAKPQADTLAGMICCTFDSADIDAAKQLESFPVKLSVTPDGGLDTGKIKQGARNAAKALKALELDCPVFSTNAMTLADNICAMMKECDADENAKDVKAENGIIDAFRVKNAKEIHAEILALARDKALMPRLPQETSRQ